MGGGPAQRKTHIVVVGNEKGGSGKSTTAVHLVVALLQAGHRVAAIDLDTRQRTLAHHFDNRARWVAERGLDLALPTHRALDRARTDSLKANAWAEYETFARLLGELEAAHDFIVIDTPGSDTPLARMAHGAADTLVTPLNDSFVDFDVLAKVDPRSGRIEQVSHYAEMVGEARRERRAVDDGSTDWVVVRNRLSAFESRNRRLMTQTLEELAQRLRFRLAPGISERLIFREFFPMGLTALDPFDAGAVEVKPTMSHLAARQEVRCLVEALNLPLAERARRRAETRAAWDAGKAEPLALDDVLEPAETTAPGR